MLDQKIFGEKLRHHRKRLGMTQEEAAEKVGVSPQAISKWEAGDCLPDCFNLKSITDVYRISADVLLETESDGDIDAVAGKIEQLGTEFIWANANTERYGRNPRHELGEDLWKMWKGLYFAECGDRKVQEDSKKQGNLHITGSYGLKIWDEAGIACVIKRSLIEKHTPATETSTEVMTALCSEDGQKLITCLFCEKPLTKQEIAEKSGVELSRLNELLLLLTENEVIEFFNDNRGHKKGYLISGHRGIAAYMVIAAMYVLEKHNYWVSQYINSPE